MSNERTLEDFKLKTDSNLKMEHIKIWLLEKSLINILRVDAIVSSVTSRPLGESINNRILFVI